MNRKFTIVYFNNNILIVKEITYFDMVKQAIGITLPI